MKTTKRILMLILGIGAIAAWGQIRAVAQQSEEILFKAGEFDLSPFGAYVDQAGGKWGAGAAATYYITDKFGLGGSTYWTEIGGSFFNNLEAEGYFRLPLFKRIAPYAVGGVGYQFDREYSFETLGAGVDFRVFKHLQAFSDVQYRFSNNSSKSGDGAFLRLGARIDF